MKFTQYAILFQAALLATSVAAAAADRQPVQAFPGVDNVPQEASTSILKRHKGSIAVDVETSGLDSASPYTLWAVIFNRPAYCQSTPCSIGDLPISPGHDPRVDASIVFAGGGVSDTDGYGRFSSQVRKAHGRVTGELVLGSGSLDTRRAEVHVVIRGHGYPAEEALFDALTTFAGGCSTDNPCEDQQFAVHQAAEGVLQNDVIDQGDGHE